MSSPKKIYSRVKKAPRSVGDTKLSEAWNCPGVFRGDLIIKRVMHLLAQSPICSLLLPCWPGREGVVSLDKRALPKTAHIFCDARATTQRRNDWMGGGERTMKTVRIAQRLSHVRDTRTCGSASRPPRVGLRRGIIKWIIDHEATTAAGRWSNRRF